MIGWKAEEDTYCYLENLSTYELVTKYSGLLRRFLQHSHMFPCPCAESFYSRDGTKANSHKSAARGEKDATVQLDMKAMHKDKEMQLSKEAKIAIERSQL